MTPYEDISFTIVVWNDAERLDRLLAHVRPWFKIIGVCVQESPDDTLEVAKKYADVLVTDQHRGFGDASYGPYLLTQMREKWTLRVDADEWPTERLLESLGRMVEEAEAKNLRGVWVPFRSWVDGFEWEEDHSHLRLFQTAVPWPPSLHSRPMIEDTLKGLDKAEYGCLEHTRSLDEMIQGYLVYYDVGRGNKQWEEHNRAMMRAACEGAAERRGWSYVTAFEWWPDVVTAAYEGKEPRQKEATMPTRSVYAAGISSSGTRMLYDIINKFGFTARHASIPGYRFGEIPDAVKHPVWWDREWMEERYGEGKWIIMHRDPWSAAQSALRRGFIGELSEYAEFADRGNAVLDTVKDGALELQYEEFVKDPAKWISEIAKFLEAPMVGFTGIKPDVDEKYPSRPDDWEVQLGWVPKAHAYKANRAMMDSDKQRCLDCGLPQEDTRVHKPPRKRATKKPAKT